LKKRKTAAPGAAIDYRAAFVNAPVGLAISRHRVIVDCNAIFAETFRGERKDLIGESFRALYASQQDFEATGRRIAPLMQKNSWYADDRVMKRLDGQLFWVHVSGFAFDRKDPYAENVWSFTDLSNERRVVSPIRGSLTPRERDISTLLIGGLTTKQMARQLSISPRTVDIYRANLLRKHSVSSTPELVKKLLAA